MSYDEDADLETRIATIVGGDASVSVGATVTIKVERALSFRQLSILGGMLKALPDVQPIETSARYFAQSYNVRSYALHAITIAMAILPDDAKPILDKHMLEYLAKRSCTGFASISAHFELHEIEWLEESIDRLEKAGSIRYDERRDGYCTVARPAP